MLFREQKKKDIINIKNREMTKSEKIKAVQKTIEAFKTMYAQDFNEIRENKFINDEEVRADAISELNRKFLNVWGLLCNDMKSRYEGVEFDKNEFVNNGLVWS